MKFEGLDKEFPADAVANYSKEHVLLRIQDSTGRVLWSLPPNKLRGVEMRPIEKRPPLGKALPESAEKCLKLMLGNAEFQTLRNIPKEMQEYFHGYLMGMQEAIAVLCGSLGYEVDFLTVEEVKDDNGTDGNHP